jgi:peptidoglycan/xylan/chitin deacetylase (PgdA/CDA1 family)
MNLFQKTRSKLNRKGRNLLRDIKHKLGFYKNFYRSARGSRIMIYHGICPRDHTRFNPIFLKLKTFEQHLKFYKKHLNVISLDDYYLQKFSNNRFNICLTFDDGFANNYKYVLPLLEKYQLPATFFITAISATGHDILWNDFLGIVSKYGPAEIAYKNKPYHKGLYNKYISTTSGVSLVEKLRYAGFDEKAEMMKILYPLVPFKSNKQDEDYWLQMTTEQISELSHSPYAAIGSHGYYHNDLAGINISEAAKELALSKQYLENITSKPVSSFAFPYGTYTPEVIEAAKEAGYKQLLAMDFHFADDYANVAMRERFTVNPFISTPNQMYATITHSYEN